MPVTAGEIIGPYELLSSIGEGGMGEVWKARDTRLGRLVAVKFSKEQFSDRFQREARAIAALNHPNICTLHDVGPNYLVMEFIEGQSVKDKIAARPLPSEEALDIAMTSGRYKQLLELLVELAQAPPLTDENSSRRARKALPPLVRRQWRRLRKAVNNGRMPDVIRTIRGAGYAIREA